jgi:hypothetical protein
MTDDELLKITSIVEAAITFKDKVERESPSCFVPSRELRHLFETIDDFMEKTDEAVKSKSNRKRRSR